ncbi:hypothetical protein IUY40_16880 [Flavobacterium sp. ALJ2]|uniref:hypothetical protein n=1 Tax=Flavobacterium sp. ALJ2 TaxID=2786960 RepID=UPI00189E8AD8|nr:hypothetical protein [Flavobacterium sp. ALJ2]MBF7093209.1 hypothetical protein [Flavobacterium sp. ALJ2]
MSTNHNRIKVADLETNQQNKILTTNSAGELEFTDINTIQVDSYNALNYTAEGKVLDARQGKVLKDLVDNISVPLASDSETQITAGVAEDRKVVSRLKLFNWWTFIKTQSQSITGLWTFKDQITLTNSSYTRYPMHIPEGVLLTIPVNGAIETDRKGIYYTINGVRKNLVTESIVETTEIQNAHVYLWGNGTVGVREDIHPLLTNLKVFNDYISDQAGRYSIYMSGVMTRMNKSVTDVKFELQMLISNSNTPTTWYTLSTYEDTRENIIAATLPQQITLSAELLVQVISTKYVFITGRASKSTSESYFKAKTKNLNTSHPHPKKAEMLVSFRIKTTTNWNEVSDTQDINTSFGLLKMIKI